MQTIEIARLIVTVNQPLEMNNIHLFRGCIANLFPQDDILFNRDPKTGKNYYRYPKIQFKAVMGKALMVAITEEGIETLSKVFCRFPAKLQIGPRIMTVEKRIMEIGREKIGIAPGVLSYRFCSPWIGLHSENYRKYLKMDDCRVSEFLSKKLIGNILSLAKGCNYRVAEEIVVTRLAAQSESVILKNVEMEGFLGEVAINFAIPNFLGIGRGTARGYGTILAQAAKNHASFR